MKKILFTIVLIGLLLTSAAPAYAAITDREYRIYMITRLIDLIRQQIELLQIQLVEAIAREALETPIIQEPITLQDALDEINSPIPESTPTIELAEPDENLYCRVIRYFVDGSWRWDRKRDDNYHVFDSWSQTMPGKWEIGGERKVLALECEIK